MASSGIICHTDGTFTLPKDRPLWTVKVAQDEAGKPDLHFVSPDEAVEREKEIWQEY